MSLIVASIGLADKVLDVHILNHKTKYKRKLISLREDLEHELNKPDHLKIDGLIDDLTFDLCLLINIFSEEIGAQGVGKKNLPTLH